MWRLNDKEFNLRKAKEQKFKSRIAKDIMKEYLCYKKKKDIINSKLQLEELNKRKNEKFHELNQQNKRMVQLVKNSEKLKNAKINFFQREKMKNLKQFMNKRKIEQEDGIKNKLEENKNLEKVEVLAMREYEQIKEFQSNAIDKFKQTLQERFYRNKIPPGLPSPCKSILNISNPVDLRYFSFS